MSSQKQSSREAGRRARLKPRMRQFDIRHGVQISTRALYTFETQQGSWRIYVDQLYWKILFGIWKVELVLGEVGRPERT